jgi:uncharacterized membrane protein YdjX (TVP38/TMEM64 family)
MSTKVLYRLIFFIISVVLILAYSAFFNNMDSSTNTLIFILYLVIALTITEVLIYRKTKKQD